MTRKRGRRLNGAVNSESGLFYLRARYYDPATGQFISRDPAVAKTRQPYAYVRDNPLNGTDPNGLWMVGGGANTNAEYGDGNVGAAATLGFDRWEGPYNRDNPHNDRFSVTYGSTAYDNANNIHPCGNPWIAGIDVGAGAHLTLSNADDPSQQLGTFHNLNANLGAVFAGSFTVSWSKDNIVDSLFGGGVVNVTGSFGLGGGLGLSSFDINTVASNWGAPW